PLMSLIALRCPWSDGDVAVTVTPGSVNQSPDWTVPLIVPVCVPCALAFRTVTNSMNPAANSVRIMIKPLVCVTDGLQLEATALVWEGKIDDVVAAAVQRTSSIQCTEWMDQSEDIQP